MISRFAMTIAAATLLAGSAGAGLAQSASTVGTGVGSVGAGGSSGVVGTSGNAAAGGTSASSLGLGAQSTTPTNSSSSLAAGGSAAAVNGHVMSHSGVHGNRNLSGQSMDQAHQPGGVWSKSHTVTHDRQGADEPHQIDGARAGWPAGQIDDRQLGQPWPRALERQQARLGGAPACSHAEALRDP